jgi:hypothetical protein
MDDAISMNKERVVFEDVPALHSGGQTLIVDNLICRCSCLELVIKSRG